MLHSVVWLIASLVTFCLIKQPSLAGHWCADLWDKNIYRTEIINSVKHLWAEINLSDLNGLVWALLYVDITGASSM